jgi:hypothetical protein
MARRLLDVFSLIVLAMVIAPAALLRAQDAAADRVATAELATSRAAIPVGPLLLPDPPHSLPLHSPPPHFPSPIPLPSGGGLQMMAQSAGIIFSGHVTFVGRAGPASGRTPAATTITFHVEDGIRGTTTGQSLTIHEWAGLWTRGDRYRVGEYVCCFFTGRASWASPARYLAKRENLR